MNKRKMITPGIKICIFATTSMALLCTVSFATSKTHEFDFPKDVGLYIKSRELCDHFRNEAGDTSDIMRKNEIDEGLNNCKGTDANLAALKYRYAKSPEVMAKLRQYDTLIEGNQRGLPRDVWSYLTARVQCDERLAARTRESPSVDSKSDLSLRHRACSRANDRWLARLKSKHANNRIVREALSEFAPLNSSSRTQRR